ncbi:hypothetical protein OG342_15955 [Streptomyces bobili]|nr:hypothetical protein [Streptomyces bobili]MCX5524347.1 hypothetical protein [Streptomyces bobili]
MSVVMVRPVPACAAVVMGGSLLIERKPLPGSPRKGGYAPSPFATV